MIRARATATFFFQCASVFLNCFLLEMRKTARAQRGDVLIKRTQYTQYCTERRMAEQRNGMERNETERNGTQHLMLTITLHTLRRV